MITDFLTAEQFADCRDELPEGGRWAELLAGHVVTLSPPDTEHGTTVLNLSKAIADFLRTDPQGYACFGLGMIVQRGPDTVRVPAMSFFVEGPAFAEADKIITETRPALVVEVASSNDRRRGLADRITAWLNWGVRLVWVLDPHAKQAHAFEKDRQARPLAAHETLWGGSVLSGFQCKVSERYKEPDWWRGKPTSSRKDLPSLN